MMLGELRGAVRLSPDDTETRLKLAAMLYRVGDLDAAADEARAAIRLNPQDAKAHVQLGLILMARQDWRGALSVFNEAVQLAPESAHARYSLAGAQYALNNLQGAAHSYRRALELQPYFPDARYRLALILKLQNRHGEAAQYMEEAAHGGVAQAQFFLGTAYKTGQGVDKDLERAVYWWSRALSFGHPLAAESLSKLRRQALSPDQHRRRRQEALDAFRTYRDKLWDEFPDVPRQEDETSVGTTLLDRQRTDAVPVLLQECYALGEPAVRQLAQLYERGWEPHLRPYDRKIFGCFEAAAADGFLPAKTALARIYAAGLGVAPDRRKAEALLKGLPKHEITAVLDGPTEP